MGPASYVIMMIRVCQHSPQINNASQLIVTKSHHYPGLTGKQTRPHSAYPETCLFGLLFQPEQCFSRTTIQPEQYFFSQFHQTERSLSSK